MGYHIRDTSPPPNCVHETSDNPVPVALREAGAVLPSAAYQSKTVILPPEGYNPSHPSQTFPPCQAWDYSVDQGSQNRKLIPGIPPPLSPRADRTLLEPFRPRCDATGPGRSHFPQLGWGSPQEFLTTGSTQPGITPRDAFLAASFPRTVEYVGLMHIEKECVGGDLASEREKAGGTACEKTKPVEAAEHEEQQDYKDATEASEPLEPFGGDKMSAKEASPISLLPRQVPDEGEKKAADEDCATLQANQSSEDDQTSLESRPLPSGRPEESQRDVMEEAQEGREAAGKGDAEEGDATLHENQENNAANFGVPSSDKPLVTEARDDQTVDADRSSTIGISMCSDELNRTKTKAPVISMTFTAVGFANPESTTPRHAKTQGPLLGGIEGSSDMAGNAQIRPIGYVPPEDGKYKELVVGKQVFLEGGRFYLSETGAYLLGLRD
ncbi:hypothetical protein cyc_03592 [Cyclospora cayetanensis]|uniref:Uncharacterized protein n=1 Tax=Cyclospora cayetanensis TaxID=88456 RepID=A0A1D3CSX8_9EIME|nr:hypothetical protein cyc_03592 [Cyclospora cayetanensis]